MPKKITDYMLEAQLPEQETTIIRVRVVREYNRLHFAQGDRGGEFALDPNIQKRIGFDAKKCIEGPALLPQDRGSVEIGDDLLLMVLVDREGRVINRIGSVILWLKLHDTRRYLERLAGSRLVRAYREDTVAWIGPEYAMPVRFMRNRREVCRNGVWKPCEENAGPRRDPSRIVSVGPAFEGLVLKGQ